ncbi:hypothetical protein DW228_06505 [Bacteroides fragilis]|uniref:Uncharacterized protein n=1 Tax=Bacteroides fragilis TaxID=817 RepID=A0A396C1I8_BACFG|nr:hypothetical protein [Bacteroides fragilis]RHH14448.1 hypothetical protein DW228_06505 [Bacteroides fragilis]
MDYVLSDEELRQTMPRNEHDKICKEYQQQIKALKTAANKFQSEYIFQSGKFDKHSEAGELASLLESMQKNAKRLLLSLVGKQGGTINDVDRSIYYRDNKKEICEALMGSIVSSGVITLESEEKTHIDKLLPDILYGLLNMLYDDFSQEPETNQ